MKDPIIKKSAQALRTSAYRKMFGSQPVMGLDQHLLEAFWWPRLRSDEGLLSETILFNKDRTRVDGFVRRFDGFSDALVFDFDLEQKKAQAFIKQQLEEILARHPDIQFWMPARYYNLMPFLNDFGYGIREIDLGGQTDRALTSLLSYKGPKTSPFLHGLTLRTMSGGLHIDQIVRLKQENFTKGDGLHWYVADSNFVKIESLRLMKQLETKRSFGLFKKDRLLGYFGYSLEFAPDPVTKVAGIDLALDQSIQGLGLGRFAYGVLLTQMKRDDIPCFSGQTAHQAVLNLAEKLGRPAQHLSICKLSRCIDQQPFYDFLEHLGSVEQGATAARSQGTLT